MGGRGSGRTSSFGLMVDQCHEFHSIDLAWLRRRKLLVPGCTSTLTWLRGGHQTGSIQLGVQSGCVRLIYRHKPNGGEWQDVNERIPLIETATGFGGVRQWFQCLSCSRRCRVLYGGAYFRCRRCIGLRYDTQYEPAFARAATRALKIRERLGSKGGIDDFFPPRPKGMHRRTYERLQEHDERLQNAWAGGIAAKWGMCENSER